MLPLQPAARMTRPLPVTRDLATAYALTAVTAVLLLVTSVAGLLFGARGLYRPNPVTLPQFLGQDGLTLVAGLPLLVGSAWAARRGSLRGLLLWMGAQFYVAYGYAYYLLSPEFNVLYPAYIVIVSASLYGLVYLLASTDVEQVRARFTGGTPTRLVGGFLMAMAVVVSAKWVGDIVGTLVRGDPPDPLGPAVWPMDLAVAFPAMFWAGFWVWRRQPLGYVAAGTLLVKAAAEGLTLVMNSYLVTLWGVPPDPMVPVYALIGGGGVVLTWLYLRGIRSAPRAPVRRQALAHRALARA